MADALEQFNSHQQDLKNRVNFLAQAIFVLAAGALSVSIAVFTGSKEISLNAYLVCALKISWWSLVASIILLSTMLSIIIARDYFFAERWRLVLNGELDDAPNNPGKTETCIIVFGAAGIIAFIIGFVGLAYAATGVIGIT